MLNPLNYLHLTSPKSFYQMVCRLYDSNTQIQSQGHTSSKKDGNEKSQKAMFIRYPPHSKGQWKNLVLASDSSNQQTLVLKKKSVESVKTRFQ